VLHWGQQESTVDTRQADLDDDDRVDKRGTGRGAKRKTEEDNKRTAIRAGRAEVGRRAGPSGSRTIWFVGRLMVQVPALSVSNLITLLSSVNYMIVRIMYNVVLCIYYLRRNSLLCEVIGAETLSLLSLRNDKQ
jgi:hypothetical protein